MDKRVQIKRLVSIGLLFFVSLNAKLDRRSSFPYISGDTFRAISDYIFDEELRFKPAQVKKPSIIFLKTDFLDQFFTKCHPKIKFPYVLITHNSDYGAPGKFHKYLESKKLIHWFGQSPTIGHSKFTPIPIGIANRYWGHGNVDILKRSGDLKVEKKYWLYLNIAATHPERLEVKSLFEKKSFCYNPPRKKFNFYLRDLAQSRFTLSPRGNSLDCHRTWEALIVGTIPIVRSSLLDSMYEGLPVVIVNDWKEITPEFLKKKFQEFSNLTFDYDRMFAQYWINKIKSKLSEIIQ